MQRRWQHPHGSASRPGRPRSRRDGWRALRRQFEVWSDWDTRGVTETANAKSEQKPVAAALYQCRRKKESANTEPGFWRRLHRCSKLKRKQARARCRQKWPQATWRHPRPSEIKNKPRLSSEYRVLMSWLATSDRNRNRESEKFRACFLGQPDHGKVRSRLAVFSIS